VFALDPHQVEAIAKLRNGKVLIGDVGSGKSITALAYFTEKDRWRKIVVITTAKKRDGGEWYDDAALMSLHNDLHVDSWNNIKNYTEEKDVFFIFDEQRVVGAGAWVDAFLEITAQNEWILLSATPADQWVDLRPVFIANGFYKNKTDFNEQHIKWARFVKYPKIDGYYDVPKLMHYRELVYVDMPFEKHTTRETHYVDVDFDLDEQWRIYRDRWHTLENRPLKDAGEMMRLLRRSSNLHPSRFQALLDICAEHPRVIVFYNHNHELDLLRTLHTELDITVHEWNGHNHQDVPLTERWIYLVQYTAGSEGWNCVSTDTMVFYSLPYSNRQFMQAHGRIDRMNTKYSVLHYYVFKSRSIIDVAIWRALTRKKNFHVSAFAKKMWPKEQTWTPLNSAA
jgi:hypothetical protein